MNGKRGLRLLAAASALCLTGATLGSTRLSAGATGEDTMIRESCHLGTYSGSWTPIQGADTADGTGFSFTDKAGAACIFHFYGTEVQWIGSTGEIYGKAEVFIDGESYGVVDGYAAEETQDTICFETDGLEDDTLHSLRIVALGEKNAAAVDQYVNIRGFAAQEPVKYRDEIASAWEEELARIKSGDRVVSDPDDWTPVSNVADEPDSGVSLLGGPLKESYDRMLRYLLHCWDTDAETELYRATVDDRVLEDMTGFLTGGEGPRFSLGGNGSQNAVIREATVAGGGGNAVSDWTAAGSSWALSSDQAQSPPSDADTGAVNLTHTGVESDADTAVYAHPLSGDGFTVEFTADFSNSAESKNLYFVLDAGDGQSLVGQLIGDAQMVFGTVGTFWDGTWSGTAFRAESWVGNPNRKVKVTLHSENGALTLTMADAAGDAANTFTTTVTGDPIYTIPGFLSKDLTFSLYGGDLSVTGMKVAEGGAGNGVSDWSAGAGWSVAAAPGQAQDAGSVDLAHTGTNNDRVSYAHPLSPDGFAVEFLADFSGVSDTQSMYFCLKAADGRELWCQMIGEANKLFGTVATVGSVQVFRAENWLGNASRKVRIRLEHTGDGALTVTVNNVPDPVDDNTYCDGLGWSEWLPGSNEGRMLAGAANALRWGEREDLREMVDTIVDDVAARMREDGYYNYYPESNYALLSGGDSERKNYDRVFWTRGMLAAGRAGNDEAYTLVRRMYDWFNGCDYLDEMVIGSNATNGFPGGPLVALSPVGKPEDILTSQRYFDLEFWMDTLTERNPLSMAYYPGDRPHTYLLLTFEALVDEYRATGDERYLQAALGGWDVYRDNYKFVGGATAICEESIGAFPPQSYYLSSHIGETCGSVFWVNINSKLLHLFPEEERYAAEIEESLFNILLAAQDERGYIRYHNNMQHGKDGTGCINVCCEVSSTDLYARLPELIYSVADDGLYVNQYAPSSIDYQGDGGALTLTMETGFPYDGGVALTVAAQADASAKLRIRVPSWAKEKVAISINGDVAALGDPGSYVTLDRRWSDGDEIRFTLPMGLRFERYNGLDQINGHARYALMYGPLLMGFTGPLEGVEGVPVLDATVEDLLAGGLHRVDGTLEFTVDGVTDHRFVPYWLIDAGTPFTCFPIVGG